MAVYDSVEGVLLAELALIYPAISAIPGKVRCFLLLGGQRSRELPRILLVRQRVSRVRLIDEVLIVRLQPVWDLGDRRRGRVFRLTAAAHGNYLSALGMSYAVRDPARPGRRLAQGSTDPLPI